ncbi:MAG: serine O-acetyltransferase [Clostridiales bacterium]|nr:serine O-acetyltransferase [Clostridiales bacterium]
MRKNAKLSETFAYIRSDYKRRWGKTASAFSLTRKALLGRAHCFSFCFWLRLSSRKTVFSPLARLMRARYSRKYGLQIPAQTDIGYGLYIGHGIGIVVHPSAKIGNNCNLSQFTTIGANKGQAATIGNNVYIGPSVCIVENVTIGDNVTIGAGSVVTKDIPPNATVAGVPAKVLHYNNPGGYISNRWETPQ